MSKKKSNKKSDHEFLILASNLIELRKVETLAQNISKKASLNEEQSDNLAIVMTELANNAIVHGNKLVSSKRVYLRVTYFKDKIEVTVRDQGSGFNPSKIENPTDPKNIWKESGRGIFLVKNLIDHVEFMPTNGGMEVKITEFFDQKNPE